MRRVLHIASATVPSSARDEALARSRTARVMASRAHVNYWVFEEAGEPARWVEFMEAGNAGALEAIVRQLHPADDATILHEVELD